MVNTQLMHPHALHTLHKSATNNETTGDWSLVVSKEKETSELISGWLLKSSQNRIPAFSWRDI